MLIVFTGNGKGKTTAALGCAMRALGYNKRVLMIQFIKSGEISGEHRFVKNSQCPILNFQIVPAGKGFMKTAGDKIHFSTHKKAAEDALKLAQRSILSGKWDLIILDEINVAINLKLIKAKDVLKVLNSIRVNPRRNPREPASMDIILTGRNAPKIFIKKADLVTEMKEVKHPFQKGQPAKIGIDF